MSQTYVLVYGTLRKGEGNHRVMQRAQGVYQGTVTLNDFEMRTLHGYFPGVQQSPGTNDSVVCELYKVPQDKMPVIDSLEGYNPGNPERGMYNRVVVKLGKISAWIYIFNAKMYGDKVVDWTKRKGLTQ